MGMPSARLVRVVELALPGSGILAFHEEMGGTVTKPVRTAGAPLIRNSNFTFFHGHTSCSETFTYY
jgi:hypothetical protein